MKYVHYGNDKFDINKFKPITNNPLIPSKPLGGFWASRMDSDFSWKNYCAKEDYDINLDKYIVFSIDSQARILTITNTEQLKDLPRLENKKSLYIRHACARLDFEKLAEKYDAIEVFINEHNDLYFELFGWDCDSLLIMNPQIIICS